VERFVRSPLLRFAPVALLLLGIQDAVCRQYLLGGVVVQLLLVFACAIGAGAGGERGLVAAFVLGGLFDLSFGLTLGTSSLAYAVGAAVAGYALVISPDSHWWLSALFTGLGSVAGYAAFVAVKLMLTERSPIDRALIPQFIVIGAVAVAASPLLVPLGRWSMGVKKRTWKAIPE
jgi:cell shape-determining protein MreD